MVSEVKDVKLDNIEQPPEIVAGISKRYIKGLIKIENQIIIFLNLSNYTNRRRKINDIVEGVIVWI